MFQFIPYFLYSRGNIFIHRRLHTDADSKSKLIKSKLKGSNEEDMEDSNTCCQTKYYISFSIIKNYHINLLRNSGQVSIMWRWRKILVYLCSWHRIVLEICSRSLWLAQTASKHKGWFLPLCRTADIIQLLWYKTCQILILWYKRRNKDPVLSWMQICNSFKSLTGVVAQ